MSEHVGPGRPHRWTFRRIGGFDQVVVDGGADLVALVGLDQKLWAALACPTHDLEFDERTLALINRNGDDRIHAQELVAEIDWARKLVRSADALGGDDALALADIDVSTPDGKQLHATAKMLLADVGRGDAQTICVDDVTKARTMFDGRSFNGDGIVTLRSADDPETKQLVTDVLACTTPKKDRSGDDGIDAECVEAFLAAVKAHAAWLAKGETDAAVRPFDDATPAAYAAYLAVRAKADDFFARCRVAAFDARALAAVNRQETDYLAIAARDLDVSASDLRPFPIAKIAAGAPLPLRDGVNPAWRADVDAFAAVVVPKSLGDRATLTESDWSALHVKFAPHEAWLAAKEGAAVEKLGVPRVRALAASDAGERLEGLLAKERDAAPHAKAIEPVERLVRYARDLIKLANNFVSFRDFYARTDDDHDGRTARAAMFQAGTLYIDTRACELCVRVNYPDKHAQMAPLANLYLLYCKCTRSGAAAIEIAAAVTAGDVDNLMVGRNGVFYDRKGEIWDATVTKIVENPISIRQAFWAPYKKVIRVIEEQVAKRAADAAAKSDDQLSTLARQRVDHVVDGAPAPAPAAPTPQRSKLDIGTVAALGVAVGGISAAAGAMLSSFFGLGFWMPIGVLGLMMLISGPSMAVAWLKLRKRNLGPLLDANGWAVNAQAKVNVPLGATLTRLAALPKGSSRAGVDPFADRRQPWRAYVIVVALLALGVSWYLGKLDGLLPPVARSVTVLGVNAPAHVVTPHDPTH